MYHIVICDDREEDLKRFVDFVRSSKEYEDSMKISTYSSGVDFLEAGKEAVDLMILDMQMAGMNGYETAMELRTYNSQAVLAFCSSVCMPSPEHFNVQPYRYLLKDYSDEKIIQAVDDLLIEMKRRSQKKRLEVTQDGKAILLEAEEILYLAKLKRGTKVVLAADAALYGKVTDLVIREKLEELERELIAEGFAKPHSSYLVNLKRVRAVDNMELLLENGESITISRSCRDEFHRAFSEFFSRKYRRSNR